MGCSFWLVLLILTSCETQTPTSLMFKESLSRCHFSEWGTLILPELLCHVMIFNTYREEKRACDGSTGSGLIWDYFQFSLNWGSLLRKSVFFGSCIFYFVYFFFHTSVLLLDWKLRPPQLRWILNMTHLSLCGCCIKKKIIIIMCEEIEIRTPGSYHSRIFFAALVTFRANVLFLRLSNEL